MSHYSKVKSVTMQGLKAIEILVEVDLDKKAILQDVDIVGLGDTVIKESKKRIKSALKNSGFSFPNGRITVNLAPSDVKKEGSYLDLPIAVGILKANGIINSSTDNYIFFGELGLDGSVRKIRGVLPVLLQLSGKHAAAVKFILPTENTHEASTVEGIEIYTVKDIRELVLMLNGDIQKSPLSYVEPDRKSVV